MTITLTPEIEKALADRALKQGKTPEQFALDTLREKLFSESSTSSTVAPPGDEWEAMLLSAGSPAGVSLSDEATSRESLYD